MSPRRNWDSGYTPFPTSESVPPEPKGEEAYSPAGEGMGESQFRRLEKKLSTLSTLRVDGKLKEGKGGGWGGGLGKISKKRFILE